MTSLADGCENVVTAFLGLFENDYLVKIQYSLPFSTKTKKEIDYPYMQTKDKCLF